MPATEYFEKGHRFRLDDRPDRLFALAGIYNVTKTADGEWMLSYAIVTRPSASRLASVHDRMPLLLAPELYDDWLDPTRVGDQELLDVALAASEPLAAQVTVS